MTVTVDHALRDNDEIQEATLMIDGGVVAAVTVALDSSTMTVIGTEKQSILRMMIVEEEDVEVLVVHHVKVRKIIANDMMIEVTNIEDIEVVAVEMVVVEVVAVEVVMFVHSRRCM